MRLLLVLLCLFIPEGFSSCLSNNYLTIFVGNMKAIHIIYARAAYHTEVIKLIDVFIPVIIL